MADAHAKHHDYHLVDPSPWPAVGSISAFVMAVGAITWMHHMFAARAAGVRRSACVGVLYTMRRLVARRDPRSPAQGDHTRVVQISPPLRHDPVHRLRGDVLRRLVLGLFRRRAVSRRRCTIIARARSFGGVWPPKGIETFDPWHLPLLNTLILLTSGTTVTWAHHALLENDRKGLKWGLMLTILLGLIFTCVQAYEYAHAAFAFAGNIYGATFFMATGFHGFHVHRRHDLPDRLPDPRLRPATSRRQQHLGFEVAAWYWHFVDVVWLFLFACIYVWGAGARPSPERTDRAMTFTERAAVTPPFLF